MDYLLDEDFEMELLSAIAFEDDVLTQEQPAPQFSTLCPPTKKS